MLHIQHLEAAVDEDVFVLFAEAEDRGPVFEDTVGDADLSSSVDAGVRFVFTLPWCGN